MPGDEKPRLSPEAKGALLASTIVCVVLGWVAHSVTGSWWATGGFGLILAVQVVGAGARLRAGSHHGGYKYESFARKGDPGGTRGGKV